MTVAELIKKLQMFPPSVRVLVKGYEGGWDNPEEPKLQLTHLDIREDDYMGSHEECGAANYKEPVPEWACYECQELKEATPPGPRAEYCVVIPR